MKGLIMSCETITREKDGPTAATGTVAPDIAPLRQVLEIVRRDSRNETDEYLHETTVPHGGE